MSLPLVAVVGRPNVGKSTFFNKVVGRRVSIVEDTPGVTRDRIYAEAEWCGIHFALIDTGGIEPDSKDVILSQMREQAEMAIDTSDVILFMVDGKEGLTAADREVGEMLMKTGKKVILAVNKIDRPDLPDDFYDFYELGLGEPIPISSANMLNLGDLLDEIISSFPEGAGTEEDDSIKIAMIGKPNVGKSSLLNILTGEEAAIVTDIAGTTRDILKQDIKIKNLSLKLIDTAGIRDTDDVIEKIGVERAYKYADEADLILMMMDSSVPIDEQDIKLFDRIRDKNAIILLNKSDLPVKTKTEEVRKYTDKYVMSVSAKDESGIDEFKEKIEEMFISGKIGYNDEVIITNERHLFLIDDAINSVKAVLDGISAGYAEDFLSIDLMNSYESLGKVIGEKVEDDIVDEIFSKFCMGK